MLWGVIAYGLVPLGAVMCFLLLSGNVRLENLGVSLCSSGMQAGELRIQLDKFCVLIASLLFAAETMRVETAQEAEDKQLTGTLQDRARMNRWRHERNYWISLYLMTLWSVAWRVTYIIQLKRVQEKETDKIHPVTDPKAITRPKAE